MLTHFPGSIVDMEIEPSSILFDMQTLFTFSPKQTYQSTTRTGEMLESKFDTVTSK